MHKNNFLMLPCITDFVIDVKRIHSVNPMCLTLHYASSFAENRTVSVGLSNHDVSKYFNIFHIPRYLKLN